MLTGLAFLRRPCSLFLLLRRKDNVVLQPHVEQHQRRHQPPPALLRPVAVATAASSSIAAAASCTSPASSCRNCCIFLYRSSFRCRFPLHNGASSTAVSSSSIATNGERRCLSRVFLLRCRSHFPASSSRNRCIFLPLSQQLSLLLFSIHLIATDFSHCSFLEYCCRFLRSFSGEPQS